jgi:hypothetical protein
LNNNPLQDYYGSCYGMTQQRMDTFAGKYFPQNVKTLEKLPERNVAR